MKKYNILLFLVLLVFVAGACHKKATDSVTIVIHAAGLKNSKAAATVSDMVSGKEITLSESTLDSSGNATLKFALDHPVFGVVAVGDVKTPVYAAPGDEIRIMIDSVQKPEVATYEGDETDINNYLVQCEAAYLNHERVGDKYFYQMDQNEILANRDSLLSDYHHMFAALKEKTSIDEELAYVLEIQAELKGRYLIYSYVRSKYVVPSEIPAGIKKSISKVSDDSLAFLYKTPVYSDVAGMFLEKNIYTPIYRETFKDLSSDSLNLIVPAMVDSIIEKAGYSDHLTKMLRAKNILNFIELNGITPQTDQLYSKLKKTNAAEIYLGALQKEYGRWLSIGAGKPAPEISGETPDGKKLSLSDLRGKVVYVDVWATWCAPCRAELPFSKKLLKEFEGNDQVAFLFLSVDESIEDWHKMLKKDKEFGGVHINQKQHQQPGAVFESYLIPGIPRYILIDDEGKIVLSSAPRPSTGKVGAEIKVVLEKKKVALR